ncbi:MAG: hypothetical protein KDB63_08145 [Nocardioidaceae bacterium]|nr:hypothetical protein [Nocardioidaceae bacterium]
MAPLTGILVGMVIAAFDFRINSVDVIADPVGWILIAIFAGRLAKANRWFGWTRAIAWAGALFAVPDMFGLGTQGIIVVALALLQAATLFTLCTGMIQRLGPDHPATRWLNVLRWADVIGTIVTAVALPTASGTTAGATIAGILLILVIGTALGFLVLAITLRGHPQLQAVA